MNQLRHLLVAGIATALLSACGNPEDSGTAAAPADPLPATSVPPVDADGAAAAATPAEAAFETAEVTRFDSPWAMTFLPDGRLLVTEMAGPLHLYDPESGSTGEISGVPEVRHVAQGGLGDVVLHPRYADNRMVYLSFVEGAGTA